MMEAAIEAGADDVSTTEDGHEIITSIESLRDVAKALEEKFGELEEGDAGLAAAEHDQGRRRGGREDTQARRHARRQ